MTADPIAVVGPGRMGIGIATAVLLADRGHPVILIDTKKRPPGRETEALENARRQIQDNLELLERLGLTASNAQELIGGLTVQSGLNQAVAACSFVFEALPEIVALKQEFYRSIGPLLKEDAVIASATSTFHLEIFWEVCSRPGNILCAHWLNPAFLIPLVEVAHGEQTSTWAADRLCDFLRSIGKIPVTMKTCPGFIVPRIQAAAMNEAIRILEEGVSTAQQIDTAIKAGFGFRLGVMGLIEFVDLGGVDILYHAGAYLHDKLGGEHFKPPRLVEEKMDKSETGPRTGKGFYDYTNVDLQNLFNEKYMGFVELLELYRRSKHLNFAGGIGSEKRRENKRKEMP